MNTSHMARLVLAAFLFTFVTARCIVFLIMLHAIPDLYVYMKGTHIHHLNYGIFLLSGLAGYLLFASPGGRRREVAAVLYGIGMGLTFDEFGMWMHLGGSYWQRASWDAVTVIGMVLALIAFASTIRRIRPRHWFTGILLACAIVVFFVMLRRSLPHPGKTIEPKAQKMESTAPHQ
ncbi:MAG: hypothetical protein ABFE13_09145 [Phycisphaerales bacterium]